MISTFSKQTGTSNLGGPFTGFSSKQTMTNYKTSELVGTRKVLRMGWNTAYATGTVNDQARVITPFRAVNNSGDFLSRKNYSSGGPNPTNASRPGYSRKIGSIWTNTDATGIPASSCNVKFVADSSEYIKFKKQQANNRNYNDLSQGGYNNSAYSHITFVR
jgi:hypothetical protein